MKRLIGWLLCWMLAAAPLPAQTVIGVRHRQVATGGGGGCSSLTPNKIGYAGGLSNNNTVSWTGGGSDTDGCGKAVAIFSDGTSSTYSLAPVGASGSSSACSFTEYTGAGIAGVANGKWHIFLATACKSMTGVAVTQVTFAGYRVFMYSANVSAFDTGINGAVGYLQTGSTNFAGSGTWGGALGTLSTANSLIIATVATSNGPSGLDSISDSTGTDTPNPASPDLTSSGGNAWYRVVASTTSPTISGPWAKSGGAGIEVIVVVLH
jgi:hypothetical protein